MEYIIVSDESVNDQGFRVLSSGIDIKSRFEPNPIMHYVHQRAVNGKAKMPIGKWTSLQLTADGKWIAKPFFDEGDPDGADAKRKWELGILNTASIYGEVIELSEDPALMLPGQMFPTVTKLILDEISICDKPSNRGCIRLSYQGRTISLSANADDNQKALQTLFYNQTERSMKNLIAKLNSTKHGIALVDNAAEADIMAAVDRVLNSNVELSGKNKDLETEVTTLKTSNATLEQKLKDAEVKATEDKATGLVEAALSAGKIVAGQKDNFIKLAKADYDSTKVILDGMTAHTGIGSQLNQNGGGNSQSYLSLSKADKVKKYDELHKSNELVALKSNDFGSYEALFEAKYGTKPRK